MTIAGVVARIACPSQTGLSFKGTRDTSTHERIQNKRIYTPGYHTSNYLGFLYLTDLSIHRSIDPSRGASGSNRRGSW